MPRVEGKAVLVDGKFGKAFKGGPQTGNLYFPTEGIINKQQGTIEMWVSPADWAGTEKKFHAFFDAHGEGVLYLYKYYSSGLLMVTASEFSGPYRSAETSIDSWKPGQWHHIAGTWSPTRQVLYIDGKPVGSNVPRTPKSLKSEFLLGDKDWPSPTGPRTSSSLIDRVRIYDRILTDEHIAAHYKGDFQKVVPLSSDSLTFNAAIDPDARTMKVQLDNNGADADMKTLAADFSIVQSGKTAAAQLGKRFEQTTALAVLPLKDLKTGDYDLKGVIHGGKQKPITLRKSFTMPSRIWAGNTLGKELKVLKPWTPIQVKKSSGKIHVQCWGRSYQFGESALPVQISSRDSSLLARPIELKIISGGIPLKWEMGMMRVTSSSPVKCTLEGSALAQTPQGTVTLKTKFSLEYDGLLEAHLSLAAPESFKADSVTLDVPMRSARALYSHRWAEGYVGPSGAVPAKSGVVDSERFIPYAWLGDNDRGLFWFCESGEKWPNYKAKNAFETVREANSVTMRFRLLEGQALPKNWNYQYGLQATPVKPLPSDWRKRRFPYALRTTMSIIWPEPKPDSMKYFGYPEAANPAAFQKRVNDLHARGLSAIPYSCLTFLSGASPEWQWFGRPWAMGSGDSVSSDVAAYGASINMVSPVREDFQDFIVWKNREFLRRYKLDGFYHDLSHPWGGSLASSGLGWQDGDTRQPTYPILAYRRLYRRLSAMAKKENPDSFLIAHTSSKMAIPMLAYDDAYLEGETSLNKVKDSYPEELPLDKFRTIMMGRQWGLAPWFLPELEEQYRTTVEPTRGLVTMLLLHDVGIWPKNINMKVVDKMFNELDAFGYVHSTFIPYFDPVPPAATDLKDVYISAYKRKDGAVLAIVGNLSRENRSGPIKINRTRLGQPEGVVRSWPDKKKLEMNHGAVTLTVPRQGYRMLFIGPPSR